MFALTAVLLILCQSTIATLPENGDVTGKPIGDDKHDVNMKIQHGHAIHEHLGHDLSHHHEHSNHPRHESSGETYVNRSYSKHDLVEGHGNHDHDNHGHNIENKNKSWYRFLAGNELFAYVAGKFVTLVQPNAFPDGELIQFAFKNVLIRY